MTTARSDRARTARPLAGRAAACARAVRRDAVPVGAAAVRSCSRCSPRWCCRGSAARRRCGRWRWCSSRRALLAGYAYAHLLVALAAARACGALVHLGVLAAAALTLPIGIAQGFGAPPTTGIALWLIGLFAASIGLPFAALVGERAAAAGLVRAPPATRRRAILTCSMPHPISARSRR